MSREMRKVPAGWVHPQDRPGHDIPLFPSTDISLLQSEWDEENRQWQNGFYLSFDEKPVWKEKGHDITGTFENWSGRRPCEDEYMPEFGDSATHYQMYETCSEGTPISPVFSTPEECARWCADNNASWFGSMGASYESWLGVNKSGAFLVFTPQTGFTTNAELQEMENE